MEGLPPLILRWITGRERGTGWTSMVKSEIVPQLVYGGDKYSMPMQAVATGDSRAAGIDECDSPKDTPAPGFHATELAEAILRSRWFPY
jgi:hypothetical protein